MFTEDGDGLVVVVLDGKMLAVEMIGNSSATIHLDKPTEPSIYLSSLQYTVVLSIM